MSQWRNRAYNAPIYPTPSTPGPAMTETTAPPSTTELDDELKAAVTRLLTLQQTRTDIEAEEARLKTLIRSRLHVGDRGTVNGQTVLALSPNRRFSPSLAEQVLPASLLDLCKVTKVDSSTAKKTLPPALYDSCMAEVGEPVVKLL